MVCTVADRANHIMTVPRVGAYADNLNWGMEAATRSANRVAKAIHQL